MADATKPAGAAAVAYETVPNYDGDATISLTILEGSNPKRSVQVSPDMTVHDFKRSTFPEQLAGRNVRVIHCGRLLADDQRMGDCGLQKSPFLHVSISSKAPALAHRPDADATVIDMNESMEEADRRLAVLLSERDDTVLDVDEYEVESMPVRDGDQQDFVWGRCSRCDLGW